MKRYFAQEIGAQATGSAGLTTQIASALAMLGLCYLFTPGCAGAGDTSLASICTFERSGPVMHQKSSTTADIDTASLPSVCQQCDAPVAHAASSLEAKPGESGEAALLRTSQPLAAPANPSNSLMMVSLSTADRHWCMAEAFNASLDHKQAALPLRQTPVVAVR